MSEEIKFYHKNAKDYVKKQIVYFNKIIELNNMKIEALNIHKEWYKSEEEKMESLNQLKILKPDLKDFKEKKVKIEKNIKHINEKISKLRKNADKKKVDIDHLQSEVRSSKKDLEEELKTINRTKPKMEVKHPPSFF